MQDANTASIDAREVEKFGQLAAEWWNPDGPFRPLHLMNPVRLDFIRDQICAQYARDPDAPAPLAGLTLVDVGCGGGLLCEPMARIGATVTGIDAAAEGVEAARLHANAGGLEIDYRAQTAEDLVAGGETFDVVLALEIVEHVADVAGFLRSVAALAKPGGLVIVSTVNRTPKSFALAIIGAEYLLRWLPRGTHDWRRFPTPDELGKDMEAAGLTLVDETGFVYAPLSATWSRSTRDLSVNYALVATR